MREVRVREVSGRRGGRGRGGVLAAAKSRRLTREDMATGLKAVFIHRIFERQSEELLSADVHLLKNLERCGFE